MFTNEWLEKIQKEYGAEVGPGYDDCATLLDMLRISDENTPKTMTVGLLHRLLNGTSYHEISDILGKAARYNDLLNLFLIYEAEADDLKKKAETASKEEKEALKARWETAIAKKEAYWTSIEIAAIPVNIREINGKLIRYIDINRI